jgi:hypothetical protein
LLSGFINLEKCNIHRATGEMNIRFQRLINQIATYSKVKDCFISWKCFIIIYLQIHRHTNKITTVRWFSPGTPVSSTYKTDRHDITEILLKGALNTINQTNLLLLIYKIQIDVIITWVYFSLHMIGLKLIKRFWVLAISHSRQEKILKGVWKVKSPLQIIKIDGGKPKCCCPIKFILSLFNNQWDCTTNYLCNQSLSPLKLWAWTPSMARCTRYNIMW